MIFYIFLTYICDVHMVRHGCKKGADDVLLFYICLGQVGAAIKRSDLCKLVKFKMLRI